MLVRVMAWVAVIFGLAITVENLAVGKSPNLAWLLFLMLGIVFFVRNGFLKKKGAGVNPPAAR